MQNGNVVPVFVLTDIFGKTHPATKQVEDFVVNLINLMAQVVEVLQKLRVIGARFAKDQFSDQFVVLCRGNLLCSIAPGSIRCGVHFRHQAVEIEVEGMLRYGLKGIAPTTNMAIVANHRQIRELALEFYRNLPAGHVAVVRLSVVRKPAVNDANACNARSVHPLYRANPELKVGIDRVFNQHGNVYALERIGHFLHRKWINRCARANPKHVNAVFQRFENVLGFRNFCRDLQPRFFFHPAKPA